MKFLEKGGLVPPFLYLERFVLDVYVNAIYFLWMKSVPQEHREYSISQLAAEFGVTARTLRFYEDKDLVRPARSGQTRVYSAADHARLRLILRGKRVGFTLDEIREMMDLETLDSGSILHMNTSLKRFRARIKALQQQRSDIGLSIADLEAGCAWLQARLVDREPSDEIKRNAQAFEALALARLET